MESTEDEAFVRISLSSCMFTILGFFGSGLIVDSNARAQDQAAGDWKYRGEVFGGIGLGNFNHGDNHLGNGLDLSGGLGVRPFAGALKGLGFEVLCNGLRFNKSWGDGYSYDGKMHAITGNALYHFGRSRTQFYVVGGIGSLKADYIGVNPYTRTILNDPNYAEKVNGTKMALNLGVGVKARITSRLSVRPELRMFDTTIGKGYNWTSLRLSLALGYHF
jgi:hypothetical protein